ncbi:MAG: RNA 2',3'-cyclic phosphodiesterase [Eubacterium sp.]|nr:RNA 2',3'-cyclic phosphodiesterase [Eubacterium sp.]
MRLFVALRFDDETIDRLLELQEAMKNAGIEGRYVPRENLHMTLLFIGEYKNPDDILDLMEEIRFKPFHVRMEHIEKYRDLYTVAFSVNNELEAYVRRLRRALGDGGVPFDRKKFYPHVTMVRKASCKEEFPILPEDLSDFDIEISHVSLMRSEQGKNGMIYSEMGGTDTSKGENSGL